MSTETAMAIPSDARRVRALLARLWCEAIEASHRLDGLADVAADESAQDALRLLAACQRAYASRLLGRHTALGGRLLPVPSPVGGRFHSLREECAYQRHLADLYGEAERLARLAADLSTAWVCVLIAPDCREAAATLEKLAGGAS